MDRKSDKWSIKSYRILLWSCCLQDLDSMDTLGLEQGLSLSMPDLGHIMVKKKKQQQP